ncbi:MAG: hypothetical protein IRY99_27220, partial [Isosphaeraceae bacterium]|nr:hypothetical protein [Isosphaeraceae bacterium]
MLHQTTATVLPGAEMPEEAVTRPLRLAVYGFIGREGGGFSAANSVVLDRLLRLGHRIDLYANAGFVHPHELEVHANYRYEPVTLGTIDRGWDLVLHRLPAALRDLVRIPYGELANAAYERAIARRIRDRHAQEPYDALLFLGLLPSFRIRGLPIIGWPQGSPLGEWEAIRRLRSLILRYGGWRVYG